MLYYAIPGTSEQYVGPEHLMPSGVVLMQFERPTPDSVAKADGTWLEDVSKQRIEEILDELRYLDIQSVRPLRAKISGIFTEEDDIKLKELEDRAQNLRNELNDLKVVYAGENTINT